MFILLLLILFSFNFIKVSLNWIIPYPHFFDVIILVIQKGLKTTHFLLDSNGQLLVPTLLLKLYLRFTPLQPLMNLFDTISKFLHFTDLRFHFLHFLRFLQNLDLGVQVWFVYTQFFANFWFKRFLSWLLCLGHGFEVLDVAI